MVLNQRANKLACSESPEIYPRKRKQDTVAKADPNTSLEENVRPKRRKAEPRSVVVRPATVVDALSRRYFTRSCAKSLRPESVDARLFENELPQRKRNRKVLKPSANVPAENGRPKRVTKQLRNKPTSPAAKKPVLKKMVKKKETVAASKSAEASKTSGLLDKLLRPRKLAVPPSDKLAAPPIAPPPLDVNGFPEFKTGHVLQKRYIIQDIAGSGTFGKVYIAEDQLAVRKNVAIKILKNTDEARKDGKLEVDCLKIIKKKDPRGNKGTVLHLQDFDLCGHLCIVNELLGMSLLECQRLAGTGHQRMPVESVRLIGKQICSAVKFLHGCHVIHTDLKLENVVFACPRTVPQMVYTNSPNPGRLLVKLVDLGSAVVKGEHKSEVITTRSYRAPEVVTGLGWDKPVDVWGIGCILFELYTGHLLFDVDRSIEHLSVMEKVLGPLPDKLRRTEFSKTAYHNGAGRFIPTLRLDVYDKARKASALMDYRHEDSTSCDQLFDLIRRMLEYDPSKRITTTGALRDRFLAQ